MVLTRSKSFDRTGISGSGSIRTLHSHLFKSVVYIILKKIKINIIFIWMNYPKVVLHVVLIIEDLYGDDYEVSYGS